MKCGVQEECLVDRVLWALLDHPPRSEDRAALLALFAMYAAVFLVAIAR